MKNEIEKIYDRFLEWCSTRKEEIYYEILDRHSFTGYKLNPLPIDQAFYDAQIELIGEFSTVVKELLLPLMEGDGEDGDSN